MSRPFRALFATDLDGTLIGLGGEVSPRNLEAMRAAEQAGVVVAIVTGRRASTVRREYPRLDGLRYRVAASNGAVILGPDNRRPEAVHPLGWEVADAVSARADLGHANLLLITAPGEDDALPDCYVREGTTGRFTSSFTPYRPESLVEAEPAEARRRALVHVAVVHESRDEADLTATRLKPTLPPSAKVHVVRSPYGDEGALTEILPRGGKGLALGHLARTLGIPTGSTGAIGDELNDEDLLDAAHQRYAVRGTILADRRPDARTTESDADQGAVAEALEHFLSLLD